MWHSVPLTLFWFTYFGALGIFSPYFGLYLKEKAALSGTELGLVLSMLPLVGIIAQPLWGQIAAHAAESSHGFHSVRRWVTWRSSGLRDF
jgi:nitrate/nitrite transporter NarK